MIDDDLRRLFHEATDDVTPGDRLDAIRAAGTAPARPLGLAVVAAAVATIAVVAGVAWVGGAFDREAGPAPAGDPTVVPSDTSRPDEPDEPSEPATPTGEEFTVAVYYLGDTPHGPRLYREFRHATDETKLLAAVRTAIEGTPQDPDYRSPWSIDVTRAAVVGDVIEVDLAAVPAAADAADATEAALALEQVIRTAQAAVGERLPVQFRADGNPVAEVFGRPASEPLAEAKWSEVLSLVSISDPGEGAEAAGDALSVNGVASSYEATVPWRIRDSGGAEVAAGFFQADGWLDGLFPYRGTIDVGDLPAGRYVLEVSTADPSGGEGPGPYVDTRTFVRP